MAKSTNAQGVFHLLRQLCPSAQQREERVKEECWLGQLSLRFTFRYWPKYLLEMGY